MQKQLYPKSNYTGRLRWNLLKASSLLVLFCVAHIIHAQYNTVRLNPDNILQNVDAVQAYVQSLSKHKGSAFRITAMRKTNHALYYTLQQTYNGIPIHNTQLKVCVSATGVCRSVTGTYVKIPKNVPSNYSLHTKQISGLIAEQYHYDSLLYGENILYADASGNLQQGYIYEQQKSENGYETLLHDAAGHVLYFSDHRSYFTTPDSLVSGLVFLPDPLTSAETIYGGDYADMNDSATAALQLELKTIPVTVFFEDGIFYLKNEHIEIKDFASPFIEVITSDTNTFHFSRYDNAFEDINAFYHLVNFTDYISTVGYDSITNFFIQVDTHGAGGADQSFYVGGVTPSLQFGEGGVDDAEDADVIIHEYTHALSDHASPGSNSGFERRAIDEGYCDYFAVSYSRTYSDYNWEQVFSWDGHNEFWSGRNANTNKHYPEDVDLDIYGASEIWSGALMDIFDAIGKEATDQLVLENLYTSTINMTMPDAAAALLESEALLFEGVYHDTLFDILVSRGLLPDNSLSETAHDEMIQIVNSYQFSLRLAPLQIMFPRPAAYSITITNMNGVKVYDIKQSGSMFALPADNFISGVYLLTVQTDHILKTEQLLVY